jgi:hypothetical protein
MMIIIGSIIKEVSGKIDHSMLVQWVVLEHVEVLHWYQVRAMALWRASG